MEDLSSILSNLSLSDNKEKFLGEVKPSLSALTRAKITEGINSVDLIVLFDCLNTDKERQIEYTLDILKYLFSFMDPAIIIEKYGELMKHGLAHPNTLVPICILKQMERCARDDELAGMICQHPIFLPALRLLRADLSVYSEVSKFVLQVAETTTGAKILLGAETVAELQLMGTLNEVIKIRVLEVAVRISQLSQEHLDEVDRVGLLQPLHELIHVDDILVKLNAVELVTSVALTHQGLRFLESKGMISRMEEILQSSRQDPFADILMPGLIKFFGNIAHLRPKLMIVQHPNFMDCLFSMAESSDLTQRAIAFETIGWIGVSLEGKVTLADLGNKMSNCIEKLEDLIRDSPTEIRIRGMNAFSSLIKLDKENQTNEFLSITESWYKRALGNRGSPMQLLVGIVKLPFADMRLAVYGLLNNIAKQSWGRREILRFPGFPELLLDRSTERDKDGKDAKYDLIQSLVESGDAKEVVGTEIDGRLREYARLGAHHVQVQSQVAYEGD